MIKGDNQAQCPFCRIEQTSVFFQSESVVGIWDSYPLNPGHALLIPRRHIASWFEATVDEQSALTLAIQQAKVAIEKKYSPQGFTIGFNDQEAGGQTVLHLHVHVIPRYEGDVPDPRGGIRNIIPARSAYWENK
jgi:diadenosine tetraphosphate (Ap4A) HIT family hydrolase